MRFIQTYLTVERVLENSKRAWLTLTCRILFSTSRQIDSSKQMWQYDRYEIRLSDHKQPTGQVRGNHSWLPY